ncbi:class I SAM-dependent methyltransferase [Desulfospira joergensenii]|uniref:class I SAM-dependent methyltransferase n=1 Tax=Desulfospira joergensenii TaxID=53329 RepID=UPI00040C0189|nr:class I SAM-dependent methyltransferase [Desulfospira joergensenii]
MEYDAEQVTLGMIQKQAVFKGKTVLEIGCGDGKISSLLADDTELYIGIDPDENTIREAKENYDNVDFRIGNGESLVFEDSLFDLVLFTLSLHHQNSSVALKEGYRVLKNNGKLVAIEPSVKGEFQQFFHLFDDETGKIQKAYQSIMDSAFTLENKGFFEAIVRFEGKTDLCCYDFDRERVSPGDENRIMNKLEQLQPGASNLSPIILKEMLDIYLMAKA